MNQSNGRRGTLYEQVLDYARREIDEASSKTAELRRTLRLLEARVEAAKSVYESVAARLNLEDELEEGVAFQEAAYPETPPPLQAPEPPEEAEEAGVPGNGNQGGFSADLIRQHLERQAQRAAAPKPPPQEGAQAPPPQEEVAPPQEEAPLLREEAPLPQEEVALPQEKAPAPPPQEELVSEGEEEAAPAASGFPGLSEADRQLIGEYLRAKRGG